MTWLKWAIDSGLSPFRSHQRASFQCAEAVSGMAARRVSYSACTAARWSSDCSRLAASSGCSQRPLTLTWPRSPRTVGLEGSA